MRIGSKNLWKSVCAACFGAVIASTTSAQTLEPRVFNAIVVSGNERFSDQDVLATSGLQTGVLVGQKDLKSAVDALDYTAEFDDIVITSEGDTLFIDVDEAPEFSGGLTFGAGYDTERGAFGSIGLTLDGLLGGGTQMRTDLLYSKPVQTLRFDLRSANFWSEGVRGGIRAHFERYQYDNVTYNYNHANIEPYVTLDLAGKAALELRYSLSSADIYNVAATASPIIAAEAGRKTSSGIGFSIGSSSAKLAAENPLLDRWSFRFDQDLTGLGGDTKLSTSQITLHGRKNIGQSGFAVRTRIEGGATVGLGGDNPRASERFALGGSRLRGFERGSIAPTDVCAGCGAGGADQTTVLGGNYFFVARTDVLLPLFANQPKLETFIFYDVGSVWNVNTNTAAAGILNAGMDIRTSAGLGVGFDTQIGQFEAYYAPYTSGAASDVKQEFGLTFRVDF